MNEALSELIAAEADAPSVIRAMLLWFGFHEAGPVISIIVIIFDELLLVALNYCILDAVEAPVLLSDQPFCQHQ